MGNSLYVCISFYIHICGGGEEPFSFSYFAKNDDFFPFPIRITNRIILSVPKVDNFQNS